VTAEIRSLKGGDITSDRRVEFLNHVAASFDLYVKDYGQEPDGIVFVLGGIKMTCRCSWDIKGESLDGPTSMLAISSLAIQRELINPNRA